MKKILQYVNGKEMKENVDNIDDEYYTKPSAAKKCFEKDVLANDLHSHLTKTKTNEHQMLII